MPDFRNFDCDNCGACCRKLILETTYTDARREPRLYQLAGPGLDHEKFRAGEQTIYPWDGERRCCAFLDADNRCAIYATRPHACAFVEPGDAKCQQAREFEKLPILCDRDGVPASAALLQESTAEYDMDCVPYYDIASDLNDPPER